MMRSEIFKPARRAAARLRVWAKTRTSSPSLLRPGPHPALASRAFYRWRLSYPPDRFFLRQAQDVARRLSAQ